MNNLHNITPVIETILLKSFFLFMKIGSAALTYEKLGSVCRDWKITLTSKWLCKNLKQLTNFKQLINQHKDLLLEHMECQYGLLIELQNYGVLSEEQVMRVDGLSANFYAQNKTLFDMLQEFVYPQNVVLFWKALSNAGQNHITHYIRDACVACSNRPLLEHENFVLDGLQDFFIDEVYINEKFLQDLLLSGCISVQHVDHINSSNNNYGQMEILLKIIHRRSLAQAKIFIDLCKKHYSRVNDFLDNGETEFVAMITEGIKRYDERNGPNANDLMHQAKKYSDEAIYRLLEAIKRRERERELENLGAECNIVADSATP